MDIWIFGYETDVFQLVVWQLSIKSTRTSINVAGLYDLLVVEIKNLPCNQFRLGVVFSFR